MNKRIDLTRLGGFPMTQQTLAFMQDSYRDALGAIAQFVGDKVIVAGLNIAGSTATNGWISLNGELIPFQGGTVSSQYVIEEVPETRVFADNESKEVYYTKRARFGTPGALFSQLRRIGTASDIWQKGDTKDIIITTVEYTADFDAAGIGRNSRIGWALCDGQGGRPNLKGRVVVNYDPDQPEFNFLGKTGGSKSVYIQKTNLPAVKIDVPIPPSATSQGTARTGGLVTGDGPPDVVGGPTLKTNNLGDGTAMNIMNPYFVALKIIKL